MTDTQILVSAVLDLGERMLMSGGEIYRVEDTIRRICRAYKAESVNVFALASMITLTVKINNEEPYTQMRRVGRQTIDFDYLNSLNKLSRRICENPPAVIYLKSEIEKISKNPYPKGVKLITCAIISFSFSLYWGGSIEDAAASCLIGMALKQIIDFLERKNVASILVAFSASVFSALMAICLFVAGVGDKIDNIVIGNIILLVPGLLMTNSIGDMINGDMISGIMRLSEAVFIGIAIATGFGLILIPSGF